MTDNEQREACRNALQQLYRSGHMVESLYKRRTAI